MQKSEQTICSIICFFSFSCRVYAMSAHSGLLMVGHRRANHCPGKRLKGIEMMTSRDDIPHFLESTSISFAAASLPLNSSCSLFSASWEVG